ncbi:MAG TPA: RAD55 family ATPase [Candidatus Thermoplasmatota archaeon]|nr:RAD55 family ATPase [Candidatus Thermoplasmatota archaeon]
MSGKVETGVKRLDELLDGGLPPQSTTLVYGPPFLGKDVLTKLYFLHGLRNGVPGIMLLTGDAASDVRQRLAELDPSYADYERRNLAHFVDVYSKSIGAEDDAANCEYVDGPMNLNAVSLAVNNAQRKIIADHPQHRLVFDSVSTLITYTNAQTTFRFLQVLVGKAKRAGATSMLLMEQGMHSDAEVQTFKHLCDGVVEMRSDSGHTQINVLGVGITDNRGWVEYKFSEKSFDIVGSFGAGRIR